LRREGNKRLGQAFDRVEPRGGQDARQGFEIFRGFPIEERSMNSTREQSDMYNTWGLEAMEPRWLLAAPEVNLAAQLIFDARGSVTVPINAYDPSEHALTIDARFLGAGADAFDVRVVPNSTFARLTFTVPQVWQGVINADSLVSYPDDDGEGDQGDPVYASFSLSVTLGAITSTITYTVTPANATGSNPTAAVAKAWEVAWNAQSNILSDDLIAYADGANIYLYAVDSSAEFSVAVGEANTGEWDRAETVQEAGEGTILVELFTGRNTSWAAAQRFIQLATTWPTDAVGGTNPDHDPFYYNSPVHRLIEGFMLQCGGQYNASGNIINSPLPDLTDSFDPEVGFLSRGLLALANTGSPNSSSGQWFIMDCIDRAYMDQSYTIFGQMISGWELFDILMATPVTANSQNELSEPVAIPYLKSVEILESDDPEAMQSFTLIITPKSGFGGTGVLEITLDDGEGGVTVQTIDVTACGLEWFGDDASGDVRGSIRMTPGGERTFSLNAITDDRTATISVAEDGVSLSAAAVTYDPFANTLMIKTPSSFVGAFTVTLEVTFEDDAEATFSVYQTFYVVCANPNGPEYVYTRPSLSGMAPESSFTALVNGRSLLFVAQGETGVMIYDVGSGTPELLTLVDTPGHAWDVAVVGNILYVTEWGIETMYWMGYPMGVYSKGALRAWDLSNLDQIRMVAEIEMTDINTMPCGLVVQNGIAYVAEYNESTDANGNFAYKGGIVTYDVSKLTTSGITRISELKRFSFPWAPRTYYSLSYCIDIAVNGNYVYVSDPFCYSVLFVAKVSKTGGLTFVDYVSRSGMKPWGLEVKDGILYVADRNLGLLTYNVAKKNGIPSFLGTQSLMGATKLSLADVTVGGVKKKYAVVTVWDGLAFVDVTSARKPQLLYIAGAGTDGLAPGRANLWLTPGIGGTVAYTLSSGGIVGVDMTGLGDIVLVKNARFDVVADDGNVVTVTVKLSGSGGIVQPADGFANLTELTIFGGSGNTSVTITTRGGIWEPDRIVAYGAIKSLTATTTQAGEFAFSGIGSLKLGDLPNGGRIDLGWGLVATTVTLGNVENLSLISQGDIKKLTVKSWRDTDRNPDDRDSTHDVLYARSCLVISCKGEFSPDVALVGAGGGYYPMQVLKTATIGGPINDALWDLEGFVGSISVKGVIAGWDAWMMTLNKGTFGAVTGSLLEGEVFLTGGSLLMIEYGVGAIAASSWTGGEIRTISLTSLNIRGAMTGDLTVTASSSQINSNDIAGRVGRVTVGSWESGEISTRSISRLTVKGALGANLTILNGRATEMNLPRVTAGSIVGGIWQVVGGTGTVSTGSVSDWVGTFNGIGTLSVRKGDMVGATLTVLPDYSVGTISVRGNLVDSAITVLNPPSGANAKVLTLGKLTVGGAMENSSLVSAGHIGSVTLGAMLDSRVTAGLKPETDFAVTLDDFATGARIDVFTVKGIKGQPVAFRGWVSASNLGKVSLVNADIDVQAEFPTEFGLAAMTMTSYSYKDAARKTSWTARSGNPWPTGAGGFVIHRIMS